MAFAISIKADSSPIEAILNELTNFDTYKDDLYVEIGGYGVASTQERFFNQHNVDGNPWKMSWRASLQGREGMQGGQTGRDNGDLMNELHFNLHPNGVEWGSNKTYAHVFHFGAHITPKNGQYITFAVGGQYRKVKEVNIPSRTFLGINAEDEQSILNIVGAFIDEHLLRGT
ncbi:phage virion morphogenesis protein [Acinetobacter sp. YH01020]|uniref:phage virion morphogenesis protein n=1 Tax=Acinetobacter sp. YH01020 TaxID=2601034 RepID=UPI0015D14850|nr:phage virion morphogenesis protein [Acinetobacter sp. YH01020]